MTKPCRCNPQAISFVPSVTRMHIANGKCSLSVETRNTSNKGTISSVGLTDEANEHTLPRVTSPPSLDELSQEGVVENGQTSKNGDDSSINVDVTDSRVTVCDKPNTSTKNGPNSYTKLSYCACIINVFVGLIALAYSRECSCVKIGIRAAPQRKLE